AMIRDRDAVVLVPVVALTWDLVRDADDPAPCSSQAGPREAREAGHRDAGAECHQQPDPDADRQATQQALDGLVRTHPRGQLAPAELAPHETGPRTPPPDHAQRHEPPAVATPPGAADGAHR